MLDFLIITNIATFDINHEIFYWFTLDYFRLSM
jgi:hypothetical protein